MLQANELRIGNWVEWDGKYVQVDTIDKEGITIDMKPRYHGDWETFRYADDIDPIELTQEILEKAGFVSARDLVFRIKLLTEGDITLIQKPDKFLMSVTGPFGMVTIKHINDLHSLQNLYFALTGTELNINL